MAKPSHNLFTATEGEGKTHWHKVGVAWPANNGNGFRLQYNSLPLPNADGKVIVFMFDNKDDREFASDRPASPRPPFDDDLDDDVPF